MPLGPPGCGKTFLGVRLAELFYHNRERIAGCKRPILMICYTNHALDQFLSSIIKKLSLQPSQIVRVGGRSTHSEIEPFLIQKLRHQQRDTRVRNDDLRIKYEILHTIRKQIDECQTEYHHCSQQLLDATQLLRVMGRHQFLTFIEPILPKLDIYQDHWRSSKGGIYCCKSNKSKETDDEDSHGSQSDSDDDSNDDESKSDEEKEEILSEHEQAARMRNRIHCHKLNDLIERDENEIKQLFVKWLDATHLEIIIEQVQQQEEGRISRKKNETIGFRTFFQL